MRKKKSLPHRRPLPPQGFRSIGPLGELVSIKLRRVDVLLTRAVPAVDTTHRPGVTACLALIVGNPGLSQKELGAQIGSDKSTVVALVDTLEQMNWARRTKSRADRRWHELYATPEGTAAIARIADEIRAIEDDLLADVSTDDLQQLSLILERMHASCLRHIEAVSEMPEDD